MSGLWRSTAAGKKRSSSLSIARRSARRELLVGVDGQLGRAGGPVGSALRRRSCSGSGARSRARRPRGCRRRRGPDEAAPGARRFGKPNHRESSGNNRGDPYAVGSASIASSCDVRRKGAARRDPRRRVRRAARRPRRRTTCIRDVAFVTITGHGRSSEHAARDQLPGTCRTLFVRGTHLQPARESPLRAGGSPGFTSKWCNGDHATCVFDLVSPHDCVGGACPIGVVRRPSTVRPRQLKGGRVRAREPGHPARLKRSTTPNVFRQRFATTSALGAADPNGIPLGCACPGGSRASFARGRRAELAPSSPPGALVTVSTNGNNTGKLLEIKGVVVDAVFPGKLPAIYSALRIPRADGGRPDRGGAAASRRRPCPRGRDGRDRRHRPRHRRLRHRRADLGARRRRDARPRLERARRPGRREAAGRQGRGALVDPPRPARLRRPVAEGRDLRDRHQGHRPDRAVRARRQDRPLRRRRRRQDGADPGADPQHRAGARRRVGLLRRRRAHARGQRPPARDGGVGRARQGRARLRPDERAARARACASACPV